MMQDPAPRAFYTAPGTPPPGAKVEAGRDVPVTAMDNRLTPANNSPVLALDPGDADVVVAANRRDAPEPGCILHITRDGGRGWLPTPAVPMLPEAADRCYAPQVAFGPDRVLYVVFLVLRGIDARPVGVYLATSNDQGRSFSVPRQVAGPNAVMVTIALDPSVRPKGRLHLGWVQANSPPPPHALPPPPNPIMATFSEDGGRSFSTAVEVSDAQRQRVLAPVLAIGKDAVHVGYYDLGEDDIDYRALPGPVWQFPWSLVVATSIDGGRHFGRGVVAEAAVTPPGRVADVFSLALPALAADGRGNLYVGWHDARNGDWDVFVRRSSDSGRFWAGPTRLGAAAASGRKRHQYLVSLTVAPGSHVGAVFYDRSDDPRNRRSHVVYTFSSDRARTFARPIRLSTQASPRVAGDRLALTASASSWVASWVDSRNATPFSPGVQDIFANRVDVPEATKRRTPAWPLLAAVATVAGTGMVILRRRRRTTVSGMQ